MTERDLSPYPGSDAAIARGCNCLVEENNHGKGRQGADGQSFWYVRTDCTVHAPIVWPSRGKIGGSKR